MTLQILDKYEELSLSILERCSKDKQCCDWKKEITMVHRVFGKCLKAEGSCWAEDMARVDHM